MWLDNKNKLKRKQMKTRKLTFIFLDLHVGFSQSDSTLRINLFTRILTSTAFFYFEHFPSYLIYHKIVHTFLKMATRQRQIGVNTAILEPLHVTPGSSSVAYPVCRQSPHLGKFLGTGGMSFWSPTWINNPIPMSAWNSIWQWKNQTPEKKSNCWRNGILRY